MCIRDSQTAWVGTVTLAGGTPGLAIERFTRHGPAALLPLQPNAEGQARAALVWCVATQDDPVGGLSDAQRLAVLATIFPPQAGRLTGISPLKSFALGLNAERTLVNGRIVRIANAAQTLHPVAGQGLNLGLRDVHELVHALRRAKDLDQALRRAEWARAADRWSTIATTDFLARSFTWKLPGAASARGLGLACRRGRFHRRLRRRGRLALLGALPEQTGRFAGVFKNAGTCQACPGQQAGGDEGALAHGWLLGRCSARGNGAASRAGPSAGAAGGQWAVGMGRARA